MFWNRIALVISVFLLSACGSTTDVQMPIEESTEEAAAYSDEVASSGKFPLDPLVISGQLENGMRFYIHPNQHPVDRAELRLVVNAGSVLEADDQQGLAHFLEHMAFNGTTKYAKQELIDYLELTGTRFGADLNAYTSFDETVYQLQVRTDSADVFDTGLEILREWASEIAMDPDEVDKERGVVIEEWRLGRGAQARVLDRQLPVLLHGSTYSDRLPIGKPEILESFSQDRVRDFYDKWYRPDLMAVVVVGSVDPEETERKIRELFGSMASPMDDSVPRPIITVPDHEETLVSREFDAELPYGSVGISVKADKSDLNDAEKFRLGIVEALVVGMLDARLAELVQQSDPPFIAAYANVTSWVRTKKFYDLDAYPQNDEYVKAFEAIATEAERARRYGFLEGELDRQKLEFMRRYETAFNERDKTESSTLAQRYATNFLQGSAVPGIEFELSFVRDVLPEISLADVNAAVEEWLRQNNRVIILTGTEDEESVPTAAELQSTLDRVADLDLEPYEDNVDAGPLVDIELPGGTVVGRSVEPIGLTRLELSNGVTVNLMPTEHQDDEILMYAYSPGGKSLVKDEWEISADFAVDVVTAGGTGRFDVAGLEKKLAGKLVSVSPYLTEVSEGFRGSSTTQDFETLLQLVYLYGTSPRRDTVAYNSFVQRTGSLIESYQASPENAYYDTLGVVFSDYHFRRRALVPETLAELQYDAAFEIYADRFSDFGDFDFYFVGSIDLDDAEKLVTKYLGSLPSGGRQESWQDLGIRPPQGIVDKTVVAGVEQQAEVQVMFSGEAPWSLDTERKVGAMREILQIKLRETLREELGGTYGTSISSNFDRVPFQQYMIVIGFGCDPDRADELVSRLFDEINLLRTQNVDQEYLDKVKETVLNGFEQNLQSNNYWVGNVAFFDRAGIDVNTLPTGLREFYDTITVDDIRETAQQFFDMDRYAKVVRLPQQ